MKQTTLTLILAIAILGIGNAQSQKPTIENRTASADLVVEGRLTEKESFWNPARTKIFTSHTIEVFKVFKGDLPEGKLVLFTEGGIVGNDFQFVTHSFQVPEKGMGIFFLKSGESPLDAQGHYANSGASYIDYSFERGVFTGYDNGTILTNPYQEIYEKIEAAAGQHYRKIRQNPIELYVEDWLQNHIEARSAGDTLIEFSFENVVLNSTSEVEFDIYAKCNKEGIKFAASNLYIEYSQDAFGSYVVANDKIQASKRAIINDTVYSMVLVDDDAQVVRFEVTSGSLISSLYPLSTVAEEFLHVVLNVENIFALATLSFDGFSMANESLFYDPSTDSYVGFNKIAVSEPVFPFLVPHIDMIAPNPIPAGTGDVLTITGSGFGDHDPLTCTSCKVRFPDGDMISNWVYAYGRDIISWKNTEIQLKVPSVTTGGVNRPAMSGQIRVEAPEGNSNQVNIHIPYSVLNNRASSSHLASIFRLAMQRQTPDGILFQYDDGVPGELRSTFQNSVNIWCNRTNIAWNIAANDIAIAEESGTDNINSVVMRPGNTFPNANALAAMVFTGHFTMCTSGGDAAFYFHDIDIKNNEDAWNPFDDNWEQKWRNAILHELGHAHLLNHSKNPSIPQSEEYLMIADQGPFGTVYMPIQDDDATGANTIFNASAQLLSIGGTCANIDPIITHPGGNCGGIINATNDLISENTGLTIFPNPISGSRMNIVFHAPSDGAISIRTLNLFGIEVWSYGESAVVKGENILTLDMPEAATPGIYFLTLSDGNYFLTSKVIKL